ncbi:hypothetical protein PISMIDRAFT_677230, partial [Pisolithus microcarpus 441]
MGGPGRGPSCHVWHSGSSEVSLLLCRVEHGLTVQVTWDGGDSDMKKHCATVGLGG